MYPSIYTAHNPPLLSYWGFAYRLLGRTLIKMHRHPGRLEETDCVEEGREDDPRDEVVVFVVLGIHRALFLVGCRGQRVSSGEGGLVLWIFLVCEGRRVRISSYLAVIDPLSVRAAHVEKLGRR